MNQRTFSSLVLFKKKGKNSSMKHQELLFVYTYCFDLKEQIDDGCKNRNLIK